MESKIYLIIDTNTPQNLESNDIKYAHIISSLGSNILISPKVLYYEEFYIIFHHDHIEMTNFFYEGKGEIVIKPRNNSIIHPAGKTNNLNVTLKSIYPLDYQNSYLFAHDTDKYVNYENKINVFEFSQFHGDECLKGLFDQGRFMESSSHGYLDTSIQKYPFHKVDHYFFHPYLSVDVSKYWRYDSDLYGVYFFFSDVYSFSGSKIDGFITLKQFVGISIEPARYFYLKPFSSYVNLEFTIRVVQDFIMIGTKYNNPYLDRDEAPKGKCHIKGSGTITFTSYEFMSDVKYFCDYDEEAIKMVYSNDIPNFYACVGQSSAEKCKEKIMEDIELPEGECAWLRNIKTASLFKRVYVTDIQFSDEYKDYLITSSGLIIYDSHTPQTRHDGIGDLKSLSKKGGILYLVSSNNFRGDIFFYIIEEPTDFDFRIFLYDEDFKMTISYPTNYTKSLIKLDGVCNVFIRKPFFSIIDMFNYSSTINFVINQEPNYQSICIADEPNQCDELDDFEIAKTYEEFIEYNNTCLTYPNVYINKDFTLKFGSSPKIWLTFFLMKNITLTIDLPKNAILSFDGSNIDILCEYHYNIDSLSTYFYNHFVNLVFNISEGVIIDNLYYDDYFNSVSFISDYKSVEIVSNNHIFNNEYLTSKVNLLNDFSITSPDPQYLKDFLFENADVIQSPHWSYLYYNEDAKYLFESYQASPLEMFLDDDENLTENIVIAICSKDNLTFPKTWKKKHTVFFLHNGTITYVDKPTNVTLLSDGVEFDDKIKIFLGTVDVIMPNNFTVNTYIPNMNQTEHMHNIDLKCSNDSDTFLYAGSYIREMYAKVKIAKISGYSSPNKLIIKYEKKNYYEPYIHFMLDMYTQSDVNNSYIYDVICFYPNLTLCSGNYFHAADITSLLAAVRENPGTPIIVGQDLILPYPTGHHYILNSTDENIRINLPLSPISMLVSENDIIQVNYSDSTSVDIINDAKIEIKLKDNFEFNIEADTDFPLTFSLESDVYISSQTNYKANFKASVVTNNHHLYTYYIDQFKPIFGDIVEEFGRFCAHDSTTFSMSFCSFPRKDTIENIFKEPLTCKEVEVCPLSIPKSIDLFPLTTSIFIHLLPNSNEYLNLNNANDIQIQSEKSIVNKYWEFDGDFSKLIIKIDAYSSLSIPEKSEKPITIQLTGNESFIDLKSCVSQTNQFITIKNNDFKDSKVVVYGRRQIYENFLNSLTDHEGISFDLNGSQKYLCICRTQYECNQCKEDIDGLIVESSDIISDPGEDVEIRVFSNFEISSSIFTNEHNVLVSPKYYLNLTKVNDVNQNLLKGFKADNLVFTNVSNLLIKPEGPTLNIEMRKNITGLHFSIELENFLKLKVINADEEGISPSRLYVTGHGELNLYDYPSHRIRLNSNSVKVIIGVYIICGTSQGSSVCSYNTAQDYKVINTRNEFKDEFDINSKIVVFLDSFTDSVDCPIKYLRHQKIEFVRKDSLNSRLLENQNKLRVLSIESLTINEMESQLDGSIGGALFNSNDSDLFVIGVNESLLIKQDENSSISNTTNTFTIHPMSDNMTIIVDDSVDVQKKKVNIEVEQNQSVSIKVLSNFSSNNESSIQNFINADPEKVKITVENINDASQKSNKKKFPVGAIAGIVVGVVVIVAVIVLVIVLLLKKKKTNKDEATNDDVPNYEDNDFSDSIGI